MHDKRHIFTYNTGGPNVQSFAQLPTAYILPDMLKFIKNNSNQIT